MNEMKRKLKIMNHQIDQLKDEITSKEAGTFPCPLSFSRLYVNSSASLLFSSSSTIFTRYLSWLALVKEHFEHLQVEKEKEGIKSELTKLRQQNELAQSYLQTQESEEQKLKHVIQEADAERMRQKKEYDAVLQERDILGTQLIRRNDELALLYEKIKIQQSTLNKGEIQYRERLEDIRVLKLEVRKLRREKAIMEKETKHVDALNGEYFKLQKDFLKERTRVKVLEEELQSPMNIHRWRKLEGSDPNTFEMVQKIQTLQKRLIRKTEEVVEKELLIQSKERLYVELKNLLARQPGPEVADQINIYQQTLRDKTNQLKVMSIRLCMPNSPEGLLQRHLHELTRPMRFPSILNPCHPSNLVGDGLRAQHVPGAGE